jgi:nicotinate-nucleotide adenylyltransferase
MTTHPARLALLGGTFDPIHYGHLDAAEAARRALAVDQVLLVPTHDPPHRPSHPHASSHHRFAMCALAINESPGYRVTDVELSRVGRSYTIDTLEALHGHGWRPSQLFFILGSDAFAEIATWHRHPASLDAANFVVIARPGTSLDAAFARAPELRQRVRPLEAIGQNGRGTGVFLVEADTRNVSSTDVRQRLRAQEPIDDLTPPAVARHLRAHHLYTDGTATAGPSDAQR